MLFPLLKTRASDERGSALVAVLLLLMMMTALASVLAISGRTETLVARNHQTAAQARSAAEAGLNHAAQVTIAWLRQWPNFYTNVNTALDDLLVNHSTLLDPDISFGTSIALSGATNTTYEVYLVDEDDPSRAGGSQLLDRDSDATNDEDDNPDADNNRYLVIRAVGYAQNETRVELEGVIGPYELPAIISDGDVKISGNATIVAGENGGIHANGDLTLEGKSVVVTGLDSETGLPDLANGTATSSGAYTTKSNPVVTGANGGGFAEKAVPDVRASDFRSWADYILTSGGQLTDQGGTVLCDTNTKKDACKDSYGWKFDKGTWDFGEKDPLMGDATFYVEGPVDISGAGSAADPLRVTIIAEGSIDIGGSNHLTPEDPELLFVTDGDLNIDGTFEVHLAEGQILVHEQVKIKGNVTLLGQIVIEDAAQDDSLVDETDIAGNTMIIYTGDVGMRLFAVDGWRQVR